MDIVNHARRLGYGCFWLGLVSCASESPSEVPPLERNEPNRIWTYGTYSGNGGALLNLPRETQEGGTVNDFHEFGPFPFTIDGDPSATGEVFSSADGVTYYVSTQADNSRVQLSQFQSFRKLAADASLRFVVTAVELEAANFNDDPPSPDCPCVTLSATASLEIKAWRDSVTAGGSRVIFFGGGSVTMYQFKNAAGHVWDYFNVDTLPSLFWKFSDFTSTFDRGTAALEAKVNLARRIPIDVNLSEVAVGEQFTVRTVAVTETLNRTLRESFLFAFLRDPSSVGGTTIEFSGLEPTNDPQPEPPPDGIFGVAPECTGGGNAAAGTLQFTRGAFLLDELPIGGPDQVTVARTGGTAGPVSATVTTSDGTAAAGTDYTAVTTTVSFGDGDAQPRTVGIPVVLDEAAEGAKTLNVTLSDARGCASLGASNAVVTITDDDRTPAPSSFSVGGTVTGLAGSGLVLRNATGGEELAVGGNGSFSFRLPTPTGIDYDVQVGTQPTSPAQICTVSNGAGTMGGTAVTDVAVDCVTPTNGGLDPAFGGDGKVQTPLTGAGGGAVAVQPDGKIVVAGFAEVGSSDDFALARYNADGSLDETFGTGGTVTTGFTADSRDEGLDVAVQTDGKIVVVGRSAATGVSFDFALARYTTSGSLDPSFDGDGKVTTDFGGGLASARAVVMQPDGKILVVGETDADFALARYDTDGSLDATFGTGGKTTSDFTGGDIGHAVALMADGRFVVAGAGTTGIEKDFAVVRYDADGSVDGSFGINGHATADIGGVDEAFGVVVEPDGRIVAAGSIDALPGAIGVDFALARFNPDGSLDAGFGSGGKVTTNFTAGRDRGAALTRQPDGKLVLVGLTTSGSFAANNFALARYRGDGSLDAGFGLDGKLTIDIAGGNAAAEGVAIQADGKIVAAGTTSGAGGVGFAVVRMLP